MEALSSTFWGVDKSDEEPKENSPTNEANLKKSKTKEMTSLEEENEILKKQLKHKDNKISKLNQLTDIQKQQVKSMKDQLFELQSGMEEQEYEKQTEISGFSEKDKEKSAELAKLNNENTSLHEALKESAQFKKRLEDKIVELKSKLDQSSGASTDEKQVKNESKLENDLKKENEILRTELESAKQETCSIEKELDDVNEEAACLEAENANLKSSINTMRDKYVNLMTEVESLKDASQDELNTSKDSQSSLQSRVYELDELNSSLEKKFKKTEQKLSEANSKLASKSQSNGNSVLQTWKQLEDSRKEVLEVKERLEKCQQSNTEIEMENRRLTKEHALAQANLRTEVHDSKEVRKADTLKHEQLVNELHAKIEELVTQSTKEEATLSISNHDEIVGNLKSKLLEVEANSADLQKQLKASEEEHLAINERLSKHEGSEEKLEQLINASKQDKTKMKWLEAEVSQLNIRYQLELKEITDEKQTIINELEMKNSEKVDALIKVRSDIENLQIESAKASVQSEKNIEESLANAEESNKIAEMLKLEVKEKEEELSSLQHNLKLHKASIEKFRNDLLQAKSDFSSKSKQYQNDMNAKNESVLELESKIRENEMVIFGLNQSVDDQKTKWDSAQVTITELKERHEEQLTIIEDLQFHSNQGQFHSNCVEQEHKKLHQSNESLVLESKKDKEEIEALEVEIDILKDVTAKLKSNCDEHELEVESLKAALEKREGLIEKMQSSLLSLKKGDVEDRYEQDLALKEEISNLKKQAEEMKEEHEFHLSELEVEYETKLIELEKRKGMEFVDLKAKLSDREATVAALVKASVTIEGKIASIENDNKEMKEELENKTCKKTEEVETLKYEITQLQKDNESFRDEVTALKVMAQQSKMEEEKRNSLMKKKDENKSTSLESWKNEIEVLKEEGEAKLRKKDITIAAMRLAALKQEETLVALREEISELQEAQSFRSSDTDEVQRLQRETEIFAHQLIEQDSEIRKLRYLLKKSENSKKNVKVAANENNQTNELINKKMKSLEKENIELRQKLQGLEVDRTQKDRSLRSKEKELAELQKKAKKFNEQRVVDLQSELEQISQYASECEKEIAESSQYYLATIEDLENQISFSATSRGPAKVVLQKFKNELGEKERNIQSLERSSKLQGKKIASLEEELEEMRRSIGKRSRQVSNQKKLSYDELQKEIQTERETTIAQSKQMIAMRKQITHLEEVVGRESREREDLRLKDRSSLSEKDNIIKNIEKEMICEKEKNQKLCEEIETLKTFHESQLYSQQSKTSENEVERATNTALTKALSEARSRASNLEEQLRESEAADKRKKIINDQLVSDVEKERTEKETLNQDLEKSKERVNDLERGARRILELQSNITNKNVFDGKANDEFDTMMKNLQLEKDFEIDALRKDLVDAKQMKSGVEADLKGKLEESEKSLKETKSDLEHKLERKDGKISALEKAMESQEQTMNYMRAEMDQLQGNMEKVALERRAEHEEIQQEFMDTQAKATKQEREISSLKMRLEETKLKRKDEVAKLKAKISVLEEESPLQRNIQTQRDDKRIDELNEEIQHLKWQNNSLSGECETLNKKLTESEGSQKLSKNDKWRNTALKEQIKALTNRIKELEDSAPSSTNNSKRTHFAKTVQISSGQTSDSSRGGLSTVTKYTF